MIKDTSTQIKAINPQIKKERENNQKRILEARKQMDMGNALEGLRKRDSVAEAVQSMTELQNFQKQMAGRVMMWLKGRRSVRCCSEER